MRKLSLLLHSLLLLSSPLVQNNTVTCASCVCTSSINTNRDAIKHAEVACDACNVKWSMSKGCGRCQAQGPQRVGDRREEASQDDVMAGHGGGAPPNIKIREGSERVGLQSVRKTKI